MGVFFETGLSHTLAERAETTVSIMSTGADRMRMTVFLMVSASGKMAPPILLFFNKGFVPFTMAEYPDVLITSNERAFNYENLNYCVVLPHFLSYVKEGSLLLHDESTAHKSRRIDELLKSKQIDQIKIPGGTIARVNPKN